MFILATLSLFLIVIHLGFASATALASAMIPIVIAVLQGVATPGIGARMALRCDNPLIQLKGAADHVGIAELACFLGAGAVLPADQAMGEPRRSVLTSLFDMATHGFRRSERPLLNQAAGQKPIEHGAMLAGTADVACA
jgi:hypothetical protein